MTTRHLCAAPRCAIRGQHAPTCDDEGCRGCQPRVAADGLNLCDRCTERAGADLAALPELYADLVLVLATSGRPGERVSGGTSATLTLNEAAAGVRSTIRATLVSWALLVAEERGVTPPVTVLTRRFERPRPSPDFIGPMPLVEVTEEHEPPVVAVARFLSRHVEWLSRHGAAGDFADEMGDLAATARRVAYPNGARTFPVGPCPADVDGTPCPGIIRAILRHTGKERDEDRKLDQGLPNVVVCDTDPAHQWDQQHWIWLGKQIWGAKEKAA